MKGKEKLTESMTKEENMWELRFLQSIYQWFDGAAFPMVENYEALSELLCGNK